MCDVMRCVFLHIKVTLHHGNNHDKAQENSKRDSHTDHENIERSLTANCCCNIHIVGDVSSIFVCGHLTCR